MSRVLATIATIAVRYFWRRSLIRRKLLWNVLLGRPVAYRVRVGSIRVTKSHTMIVDCEIIGSDLAEPWAVKVPLPETA